MRGGVELRVSPKRLQRVYSLLACERADPDAASTLGVSRAAIRGKSWELASDAVITGGECPLDGAADVGRLPKKFISVVYVPEIGKSARE
ncbi:hypothetical protein CDV49_10040 [Haematobacter genomosp. 1]|uniref:Uncharacterized protein n=1 Tax=Haematobacter genomosp. 1 TaxID=366618 RepID=A0A212AB50_9RHOB|nr:hypothetical protein CDV49_10040 [Haematobacter genomosp. 1]